MRKFVRISNIKIILFAKPFLTLQIQAFEDLSNALEASLKPFEPDLHLELDRPLSCFVDNLSITILVFIILSIF